MRSYAQNLEDVVLTRLLQVVPAGVFIDVGAGHPVLDNVTYALYQAGWRGINVEPMQREAELLRTERPEDLTFQVAAGAAPGTVTLYEAPLENRGATTAESGHVERFTTDGQQFTAFDAEVITLASLLDRYEAGSVHVVKIDVEGMEAPVVAGADLARTRPWVLVVESTVPHTQVDASEAWEPRVLEAGYVCTLFDGLNRFYVRDDLDAVQALLSVPANVFDGWELASEARVREYAADLEANLARVQEELSAAGAAYAILADRIGEVEAYAKSLEQERARLETRLASRPPDG